MIFVCKQKYIYKSKHIICMCVQQTCERAWKGNVCEWGLVCVWLIKLFLVFVAAVFAYHIHLYIYMYMCWCVCLMLF